MKNEKKIYKFFWLNKALVSSMPVLTSSPTSSVCFQAISSSPHSPGSPNITDRWSQAFPTPPARYFSERAPPFSVTITNQSPRFRLTPSRGQSTPLPTPISHGARPRAASTSPPTTRYLVTVAGIDRFKAPSPIQSTRGSQ